MRPGEAQDGAFERNTRSGVFTDLRRQAEGVEDRQKFSVSPWILHGENIGRFSVFCLRPVDGSIQTKWKSTCYTCLYTYTFCETCILIYISFYFSIYWNLSKLVHLKHLLLQTLHTSSPQTGMWPTIHLKRFSKRVWSLNRKKQTFFFFQNRLCVP